MIPFPMHPLALDTAAGLAPVLVFRTTRGALEHEYGPPHAHEADPPRLAWAFAFPCGLEVAMSLDEAGGAAHVSAGERDAEHVRAHLPVSAAVAWTAPGAEPSGEPRRWSLWRQDDNGVRECIQRFRGPTAAECRRRRFEALAHKQIYWVEGPAG